MHRLLNRANLTSKRTDVLLQELVPATLLRRYKRFLADVSFADGSQAVVHCPNPGSMLGLAEPGMTVYLSRAKNKGAKLEWGWRLVDAGTSLVCVDTMLANKLFAEAFQLGRLEEFSNYSEIRAEFKYEDSRFDFLLVSGASGSGGGRMMVEVKSTTLVEDESLPAGRKVAAFPDARTERGLKHLNTLAGAISSDCHCAQYYVVSRSDTCAFKPAAWIDAKYAEGLLRARKLGVQVHCRAVAIDLGKKGDVYEAEIFLTDKVDLAF